MEYTSTELKNYKKRDSTDHLHTTKKQKFEQKQM